MANVPSRYNAATIALYLLDDISESRGFHRECCGTLTSACCLGRADTGEDRCHRSTRHMQKCACMQLSRFSAEPSACERSSVSHLDQQALNLISERLDLRLQLRTLVHSDGRGDDRSRHTTCTAECLLGRHEHVWHVLVLTQQRKVQQNLERLSIRREHHELANTTVQRLGRLVGALAKLFVVGGLLCQVKDLTGHLRVREGEGFGIFRHHCKVV